MWYSGHCSCLLHHYPTVVYAELYHSQSQLPSEIQRQLLVQVPVNGLCHKIFDIFFHEWNPPWPLITRLKQFSSWFRFCQEFRIKIVRVKNTADSDSAVCRAWLPAGQIFFALNRTSWSQTRSGVGHLGLELF